ncbi:MAG TPA: cyclic nucleotide-binding domain-containing protein [Kofleriaceae bacterium]
MAVSADDLAHATRALRNAPASYAAWLEVATLLEALGDRDDAEIAFATIGEGARVDGRVALAVACGRHLAALGSLRGGELLDAVIETYAGTHEPKSAATPPHREPPDIDLTNAGGTPIADARTVIAALAPWLQTRQAEQVPPAPLLSALSAGGARALIGVMTAHAFAAGQVIVEAGAPADALYWLAHGTATVKRDKTQLGELHSGAFFGEIALVGGTRRTATVTAHDDVWLLEIPARAVETAAQKHPQLAEVLAFHARQRLLANLVRTSELFKALAPGDRDHLLAKFASELVPAGTTFIHEGQPNEFLWVVVAGKCQVTGGGSVVAELGAGAAVGEISLVSGDPAVADVVAVEPAVVLKLAKRDFDVIAKKQPKLLAAVKQLIVAREKENRALFQDATDLIV